ncbi:M10 family metallopeptidase C-terminal domain-containing protein [Methylocella sp.]|uniref:M10 family metallopeptidase C-terminal domain-containing protein n=1 Tax=Methylocella sp. TaxID=1978226 RepID=UPI0037847CC3
MLRKPEYSSYLQAENEYKPDFTLPQIVTQLTTSWGYGDTRTRSWASPVVTFALLDTTPTNSSFVGSESSGVLALTPHERSMAGLSFKLWDDLIPTTLTQTNDPSAGVTFNYSTTTDGDGTYARPFLTSDGATHNNIAAQQIWIAADWSTNQSDALVLGGYGVATYIHEIGHALGLSHPGAYNAGSGGVITYDEDAVYAQDNRRYSIMSYFGGYDAFLGGWAQDGTYANWLYPETPMVDDIAAIQALYGVDTATRTGDTVYGFHSNLENADPEKAIYDFSLNTAPIFTIWDAGGIDTLDCSGYAGNQQISLVAGSYSSIDGMTDNVAIAYGCTIEKAIGGSGDDVIVTGAAADTLTGGAGRDAFKGTMADCFNDTITDMQIGETIQITDMPYYTYGYTFAFYDKSTNLLNVTSLGSSFLYSTQIFLPGLTSGDFVTSADGASGTLLTLQYVAAPAAPTQLALAGASDTLAPGDSVTRDITPTIVGVGGASGDFLNLYEGATFVGSGLVGADGRWAADAGLLSDGAHVLTAKVTSAVTGKTSAASAPFKLLIDETSGLYDSAYYSFKYADVAKAGVDAKAHYDAYGWKEGRNPDQLFSTSGYLASNPDVAKAKVNPLAHYDAAGWKEGRDPSAHFDTGLYLLHNKDVAKAGVDPLEHYLRYGQAEGRKAYDAIGFSSQFKNGSFDAEYYLLDNPDVAKAAIGAKDPAAFAHQHYETYGWKEGRNPNAFFDTDFYLSQYADVATSGVDPLTHYDTSGWKQNFDPSAAFDTSAYEQHNPDVAKAQVNPLQHYLQYGAYEGRLL